MLDNALRKPIASIKDAKRFIEALHENGLLYHFDDGAIECLHVNKLVSLLDAVFIDMQVDSLYAPELDWTRHGGDPIGYALRVMNGPDGEETDDGQA